jgi:thiol reductant ABC exporter CydD subunit
MASLDPRLLRRARTVRVLLAVDSAFGLADAGLILVQATLLAWIVAHAFHRANLAAVVPEIAALVLAFALRGLLSWAFVAAGRLASSRVLSELRLELVGNRLHSHPAALDGAESGEIATVTVAGIDSVDAYFARYLPRTVLAVVVPLSVLAYVAAVDPRSAAIMLLTLPLVPVFMWLIGRYTEERTRERLDALRHLSVHFLDVVRGLPTLRAFNRSHAQAAAVEEVSERYRRTTMATLRVAFLSGSVLELAATVGVALVAVTVGVRLVDGGLGLQPGLTVLVLAPELYAPFRQLGAEFHASADGVAVAGRIFELLDRPSELSAARVLRAPSPAVAAVRFERVSFAYPSRAQFVLRDFELELAPRETVALVGESGAGKSTVASLLLQLAEPTDGRVTVGGVDLADCDLDGWRRQVAWVPQHPTIFRGTVTDNIRLGTSAGDEDVRRAALLAGADEFARALPDGYRTVVGDGGRSLSAGECRRISLARAFIRATPLVVLDEPTADLDPDSAELVANAIETLACDRTMLVIVHPPELAARASRVVALVDGHAVEHAVAA